VLTCGPPRAGLGTATAGRRRCGCIASWTQAADRQAAEQFAGRLTDLRRKQATAQESPTGSEAVAPAVRPLARRQRPVEEVLPGDKPAETFRDVAAGLRDAIAAGRLQLGDLVPTVTEIAQRYSVATSTAQRAVSLLGAEGLTVRAGARWFVA
jgi:hypothetical protein